MYGLEVSITSARQLVLLSAYRELLTDVRRLVEEVDLQARDRGEQPIEWGVRHATAQAGLALRVEPFDQEPEERVRRATVAVVDGVTALGRTADIPPYFSETAVEHVGKLGRLRTNVGVDGVSVSAVNGQVAARAEVTSQVAANAAASVEPAAEDRGSVEGIVDSLAGGAKRRKAAVIFVPATRRGVRVQLPDEYGDIFRDAWGHRVAVHGLITYNRSGQPIRIRAESVQPLGDPTPRDRLRELVGIAPDWTEGRPVAEALDEMRRRG